MDGKTNKVIIAIIIVGVIILMRPVEQTVAPAWQVTVVDEKGIRLSGIHVRESWRQYSIEDKDHEAVLETDGNGSVVFPRRALKSGYMQRMFGCVIKRRMNGSGAICSPQASVWAFGPGLGTLHEEDTKDSQAQFVKAELRPDTMVERQISLILLHHCPPGRVGTGCKLSDEYVPTASP